jgi:hypothetical protein
VCASAGGERGAHLSSTESTVRGGGGDCERCYVRKQPPKQEAPSSQTRYRATEVDLVLLRNSEAGVDKRRAQNLYVDTLGGSAGTLMALHGTLMGWRGLYGL